MASRPVSHAQAKRPCMPAKVAGSTMDIHGLHGSSYTKVPHSDQFLALFISSKSLMLVRETLQATTSIHKKSLTLSLTPHITKCPGETSHPSLSLQMLSYASSIRLCCLQQFLDVLQGLPAIASWKHPLLTPNRNPTYYRWPGTTLKRYSGSLYILC